MNEWIWSYCVWRAVNSFWSNYSTKCLFKCISLIQFHLIRRRSTCTGSLYKYQWNASTLIHLSNPVKLNFEMEECSWQWFVQTKYEFVRFNYKRMSHHDPNRTSSLIVHTLSAERASSRNKIGLWKQKKMNYVFRFVLELITVGVNMHNLVIIFVLWSEIRFLYLAAIIIINYDFTIFPMAAMVPNILLLKIFGMISNSMRHALNLFRFLFFFL